MATTSSLCSLPAQSPTLPSISLSSLPSLKTHLPQQPHFTISPFSTKLAPNFINNDTLTHPPPSEAAAVLAVEAAREHVLVEAGWLSKDWRCKNLEKMEQSCGGDGNVAWKKRRRKRRKEVGETAEENWVALSNGPLRPGHLSSKEEAELCLCLKEAAQIEKIKTRIMETQDHEPTNKQLAIAMGTKLGYIDRVLWRARESRDRLIRCYSKLVISIAAPYQGKGISLQDLTQEGNIGLLKGAERFEPNRGHKLSTYAYWWIRQTIIQALDKKSRLVRLPGHMGQMVARIAEANNHLGIKLSRVPTHKEVAKYLKVPVSTVRLVTERSKRPISINQPVNDRGCLTLQEIMPGPDNLTPENMVIRKLMKQELKKLLNTLSKREAHILTLYFGLNGQIPQSFEEIGKSLNLSRETIRQTNIATLAKLKKSNILDYLKDYLV
ncbi:RNA polymerase sigma factor sigD, chloroplastic [Cucurbita pepo subsp. pepo]|uniref:RNA polymerase sigma factor sigD, chloroplastic n=1 Tax=Cucurbita pepo subsp. pepo TaxID=3664 RepID=UPI000C9D4AF9|nr:RNA polymerase sigma factor sigD, chloroplastic [Cucurbita pepo subsp. pepo]